MRRGNPLIYSAAGRRSGVAEGRAGTTAERAGCRLSLSGAPDRNGDRVEALLQGMSEAGFVPGRNVTFEYRWTYNDPKKVAESAAELGFRLN